MTQPTFTLIAGANGSGKSTLTRWNRSLFESIPILDPDTIDRVIEVQAQSSISAGRKVLALASESLLSLSSFAVETTLAGHNYLQMMQVASSRGFTVVLIYIGTENVETNLLRINNRVLTGGHDVPEVDVRRRYRRSLLNLPVAVSRAHHAILLDNSTTDGYRLVALIEAGERRWFKPVPQWVPPL